jgi:serine/threonine protein kinase
MMFGFPPFYVDPTKYYGQREAQAIYRLIQKGFDPRVKRGYGPWFPRKMPVSEECKDLMARLMDIDAGKRFTAKEALQHPWILHGGKTSKEIKKNKKKSKTMRNNDSDVKLEEESDEDGAITKELGYQFANFAASNQFKHAITALFRDKYEKMRPQHFENLKKLFKALDTDGNGTIDYQEFKAGMINSKDLNLNEQEIKKCFKN